MDIRITATRCLLFTRLFVKSLSLNPTFRLIHNKMRFFTAVAAGMLALGVNAQEEPITSPFYLTTIIDGDELATAIIPVSRGVPILSPWPEYQQLFTYNAFVPLPLPASLFKSINITCSTTKRLHSFDEPSLGLTTLDVDSPAYFTSEEPDEGSELEQLGENGAIYLVKAGTGAEGSQGWRTKKVNGSLPTNVFWPGQGSAEANAKLRIDLKAPTRK